MKYIAALTILLGSVFCFHTFMYADTPYPSGAKRSDNILKMIIPSCIRNYGFALCKYAVLFHHSDNVRNQDTLRNVTSSSLVKAKQLPFKKASMYIPRLSQYVSKVRERKYSSVLHCGAL